MKRFLEIGKIVKTQGIKGEVRVQPYSDLPEDLLDFEVLYTENGKNKMEVSGGRVQKNIVVMKFNGIDSPEDAQKYIGKMLYMDRDDVELEDGVYFVQDIIGMEVFDEDSGIKYGKISDILQNSSTDVYVIKTDNGKELMFPSIPEIVISRDIEKGTMTIRPLEGLFEDGEEES